VNVDAVEQGIGASFLIFGNDAVAHVQAFCESLATRKGQGRTQLGIFLLLGQEKTIRLKSHLNTIA